MIEFTSVMESARLVDPTGAVLEQAVEHRLDPLTQSVATINTALGEKAKAFLGAPWPSPTSSRSAASTRWWSSTRHSTSSLPPASPGRRSATRCGRRPASWGAPDPTTRGSSTTPPG